MIQFADFYPKTIIKPNLRNDSMENASNIVLCVCRKFRIIFLFSFFIKLKLNLNHFQNRCSMPKSRFLVSIHIEIDNINENTISFLATFSPCTVLKRQTLSKEP